MNSVIHLQDVWKRYDMGKAGGLSVLKEVNLDIKQGDFIAITGPSGSGKSTIMHIIGALDVPTHGEVFLQGNSVRLMGQNTLATLRSKTIGFIFQQFNLLPTFSALENVMIPLELIDTPDAEAKERAEALLKMMGLGERLHHKPTELSGGQQQRVAIARALANNPDVILADEPTGNLDSTTGRFVMDFLSRLNEQGKTVILVTHELSLVSYAQRVIYIRDGRIEKEITNKRPKKLS